MEIKTIEAKQYFAPLEQKGTKRHFGQKGLFLHK